MCLVYYLVFEQHLHVKQVSLEPASFLMDSSRCSAPATLLRLFRFSWRFSFLLGVYEIKSLSRRRKTTGSSRTQKKITSCTKKKRIRWINSSQYSWIAKMYYIMSKGKSQVCLSGICQSVLMCQSHLIHEIIQRLFQNHADKMNSVCVSGAELQALIAQFHWRR